MRLQPEPIETSIEEYICRYELEQRPRNRRGVHLNHIEENMSVDLGFVKNQVENDKH